VQVTDRVEHGLGVVAKDCHATTDLAARLSDRFAYLAYNEVDDFAACGENIGGLLKSGRTHGCGCGGPGAASSARRFGGLGYVDG
jgi:hypothetical protein